MAHKAQIEFCLSVKEKFPNCFIGKRVLDAGSMDINGNNNYLFENCKITRLDLGKGKNVDIICPIHEYNPGVLYDCIISTEMLEHDKYYKKSLKKMFDLLKKDGLLLLTAAAEGRREHGTHKTDRRSSPYTLDYYKNVTREMITGSMDMSKFKEFNLIIDETNLFFWGLKNEN